MFARIFLAVAVITIFVFPRAAFANSKFDTNSITPNFLVVYFHSYGSNYLEPFEEPSPDASIAKTLLRDIPGVAVLSMDRDSQAALNGMDGYRDVTQLILDCYAKHPSLKHIVLCGTSLGAYEAVVYPYYAPHNVSEKISGIISVEPTDDLAELFWKTRSVRVKQLLYAAFHGDPKEQPDYFRTHSVKTIYAHLPERPDIKACIVSAKRDVVVPPAQQRRLCATLRDKKIKVTLVEIDRNHSVADPITYGDALHFVTGR